MSFVNDSTTLTDVGIAMEAFLFCGLLWKHRQISVKCWAIAFGCTAIAAISGVIYHGFGYSLSASALILCQSVIAYAIGIASSLMVLGVVKSHLSLSMQPWCLGVISLKFLLFSSLQSQHQGEFSYVVADYLSAMLIVFILEVKESFIRQSPSAPWLMGGGVVSIVAVWLLARRWSFSSGLSPDAVYHVMQMTALYLFFRGSRHLVDHQAVA